MYNKEQKTIANINNNFGKDFLEYGFLNDSSEFLGFYNGTIIKNCDELINEENTKKLYEAMKGYYEGKEK